MKRLSLLVVFLFVLAAAAAIAQTKSSSDIYTTLSKDKNYSTFTSLVKQAGLESELKSAGPYTVFAPNNAAFAKLPKAYVDNLKKPANKAELKNILQYHITKGKHTVSSIMKMPSPSEITMLNGNKARLSHTKNAILINNSNLNKTDIAAKNGQIFGLNTVLIPPKSIR